MSQDNPTPQSPNPRGRQQSYQRRLPFWKVKIIQFLRGTIGVLETTVNKLEDPSPSAENSIFGNIQSTWSKILNTIRRLLPSGLSSQLSNTALTGIIAFVAVIAVWTTSSLTSKPPSQVATVPPEALPTPTTTPKVPTPLVQETPQPTVEPTPLPTVEPTPLPTVEPTPQAAIEQTPVVEPIPEAAPIATPQFIPLTPEQTLIAAIENHVAEVSNNTFAGIVKSIKANFRSSSLIVTISDDWYNLKQSQQDKLAAEMLLRSQELDFSHLEIFDSQDKLVARNPVVGNEMIIFQRALKLLSQIHIETKHI
jgi:hypothetical protein